MTPLNAFVTAIPLSYGALFPVLNPLGESFIFLALTQQLSTASRHRLARRVGINTFIMLVLVLFIGEWILRFFGVTISIVQVAGGLVVASIGWVMMSQPLKEEGADNPPINNEEAILSQAFFPLTMPMTAGPGSIAVALTIGVQENVGSWSLSLLGKLGAVMGILLAALTVYFCYAYAEVLTKKIGASGTVVIVKLSAFIIFCIGLSILWHGFVALSPQLHFG